MTPADVVSGLALLCVVVGAFARRSPTTRPVGKGAPIYDRPVMLDSTDVARSLKGGRE